VKKVLVISGKNRKVHYVSKLYLGARHDFGMMKAEFPPDIDWFSNVLLYLDSGFQGVEKTYQAGAVRMSIRRKRVKRGVVNDLSPEQLQYNKEVGKERIYVEHAIGGMKRYRILSNKIRLKCDLLLDNLINIAAGLWNFTIANT